MDMTPNQRDEEFSGDYLDLFKVTRVLRRRWLYILIFGIAGSGLGFAYAITIPDKYVATTVVAPKASAQPNSLLGGSLGQLGNLVGISVGSGGSSQSNYKKALFKATSFDFFRHQFFELIAPELLAANSYDKLTGRLSYDEDLKLAILRGIEQEEDLADVVSLQAAHATFLSQLQIDEDPSSGLIKFSITHISPRVARDWSRSIVFEVDKAIRLESSESAKSAIAYLEGEAEKNKILSVQKVIADLLEEEFKVLALANASAEYAFEILELAYEPEIKAEPNRASLTILGFFAAAFTFCAGILFREL